MTETLRQQLAAVFKDTLRVIRLHPWMLSGIGFLAWYVVHTREERQQFLKAALDESDTDGD